MAIKYSASERKAYHMGRAYETAKEGKRVKCPDEKTKQSFRNGINSVKGNKATHKKPDPSTCTNCGTYITPPRVKVDNIYYQQLKSGGSALVDKFTGQILCIVDTGKVVR